MPYADQPSRGEIGVRSTRACLRLDGRLSLAHATNELLYPVYRIAYGTFTDNDSLPDTIRRITTARYVVQVNKSLRMGKEMTLLESPLKGRQFSGG
jgi:hypothetical protein